MVKSFRISAIFLSSSKIFALNAAAFNTPGILIEGDSLATFASSIFIGSSGTLVELVSLISSSLTSSMIGASFFFLFAQKVALKNLFHKLLKRM